MHTQFRYRVLLLAILFAACLLPIPPVHAQHQGTLVFGGDANYPPFEWQDGDEYVGFNIDLEDTIEAIGHTHIKHRLGNWPEMVQALEEGEIDVLPMFVSEEREKKFLFTSPFYYISHAIYAATGVESLTSLNALTGQRIAVEASSYAHRRLKTEQPDATMVLANNTLDALDIIASGKADYAVLANPIAARLIEDNKLDIARNGPPFWPKGYAFAVRKDKPELAGWLEDNLNLSIATGAYNDVYQRWVEQLEPSETTFSDVLQTTVFITVPILLLAVVGFVWSWSLKRIVNKRTRQLTQELESRKKAQAETRYMVDHDELTGLPKQHHVIKLANQMFQNKSPDSPDSMEMITIKLAETEMFTRVFGHAMVEALLKAFAERLKRLEFNVCGYIGRGVFTVICHKNMFINQLDQLTAQINVQGIGVYPQVIGGIACWPVHAYHAEELGRKAETALSVCLERNQNWAIYDQQMEPDKLDLQIVTEFRKKHVTELYIALQPQIDLASGQTVAAEALVRWHSSKLGVVSPGKFIPLLEKAGLIHHVTDFVIDEAVKVAAKLRVMEMPCKISINVSASDLQKASLVSNIQQKLERYGARAEDIKLELTETAIADRPEHVKMVLDDLSRLGVHTSIDDFGTGYSSLSYLSSYPIDEVKIDQMFVRDMADNPRNRNIVRSTIALAHSLGLKVVAEGAEDEATVTALKHEGCDQVQGYVISAPVNEDSFINFMLNAQRLPKT